MAKEHGPAVREPYQQRDSQQQRRQHEEHRKSADRVEGSFGGAADGRSRSWRGDRISGIGTGRPGQSGERHSFSNRGRATLVARLY